MRTTLSIEPVLAQKIRRIMAERKMTLKQIVNELLRAGLAASKGKKGATFRFRVEPHRFGFRGGIDQDKLNQLLDQLEAEETARKVAR